MPLLAAALTCIVIGIADGDTLAVHCEEHAEQTAQTIITIRLAEIDAPEKAQPFGNRSRQHLAALCFQRKAVVAPRTTDRYGRTVARIECDGADASAEQVRAGMAWAFTKYLTDPQIKAIEMEARSERRGLWAEHDPVAPWNWRRGAASARK